MGDEKDDSKVEMEVDAEGEEDKKTSAESSDANEPTKDEAMEEAKSDSENESQAISGKKRPRSPTEGGAESPKKRDAIIAMLEVKKPESGSSSADKIPVASIAAASQLSTAMGWNGLGSLLSLSLLTNNGNSSSSSSARRAAPSDSSSTKNGTLPSKEQVEQSSIKAVNDAPPFVHLSKTDSAPQLKITDSICASSDPNGAASETAASILVNDRLACKQGEGEMRGYRMTRSSHGVSAGAGNYYYEVVILEPPTARELVKSLPPNVRLGKKLQREMEKALREQEEQENEAKKANESATGDEKAAKMETSSSFGAHVRLGWSMRTGDLQAPVGYDKWSYGIRDIQGSKMHCSKRDDNWGGEDFGPGDVVGCAISMVSDGSDNGGEGDADQQQPRENENHIRFFKNGLPMGEFVITKGKRSGGEAFTIPDGVYYPAISLYMGATVKVNFGPHFIHPPRKLPTGMFKSSKNKKGGVFQPMSDLCKAPLSVEEASAKVIKEQKTLFFRKADNSVQQKRFLELVETEVKVQREAYQNHRRKHVLDVMEERKKRKLKCDDLEQDDYYEGAESASS